MKNRLIKASTLVLSFLFLLAVFVSAAVFKGEKSPLVYAGDSFSVSGKAAYLMDAKSGTVVYAKNEKDRLPIASMVKIMTSLLTFEAIEREELSLDEMVTVSETAAGMGGSQVFLDAGSEHSVSDLIKSVIVASANDSCVALAERISGSVSGFVGSMNDKAQSLGLTDTHFVNCTGLPAAESFSSARDVAIMLKELIRYPKYFEYSGVWLEEYPHPSGRTTTITNTNKLIRFYNGCDGGKTGFTSEAKFCLAGTAKRGDTRIIAVVIGADSSKERFGAVSSMFDFAFNNYESRTLVSADDFMDRTVAVSGGKSNTLGLKPVEDVTVFTRRGDKGEYTVEYDLPDRVKAPIAEGDGVGKLYVVKNGEIVAEYPVLAAETVKKATLFDVIGRIAENW